jgi:dihydrolipoamide dehydrogenase
MEPVKTEVVVVGGGPGGYTAAFYAADRGEKVVLVEQDGRLGGVCLNRGCIPSKALLYATKIISEAKASDARGIVFGAPKIDINKLRSWKDAVVEKLSQGVANLAKVRGVEVMYGRGHFEDSRTLRVETSRGQKFISFDNAVIAVGTKPAMPSAFDLGNPRIMTSNEALELKDVPKDLLIVGGGYIGMELGTVYATLGSRVVLLEALDSILVGADPDLVRPVMRYAQEHFKAVHVKTKVIKMATSGKQIKVTTEADKQKKEALYDRVLVCVGRNPNCGDLGLQNTKVERDDRGFIKVNGQQQTTDPGIYAIGDVTGGELLAHRAFKEARVAVEALVGENSVFADVAIPAVIFTDPEVAWCGLTETEAKRKNIPVRVAKFPWAASGRALSADHPEGLTKLVIEPETERVLGVGIVGAGAGELISEGVLAVESGLTAKDVAESIHPHPTLSETIKECAEVFYGTATHTFTRKKTEPVLKAVAR